MIKKRQLTSGVNTKVSLEPSAASQSSSIDNNILMKQTAIGLRASLLN